MRSLELEQSTEKNKKHKVCIYPELSTPKICPRCIKWLSSVGNWCIKDHLGPPIWRDTQKDPGLSLFAKAGFPAEKVITAETRLHGFGAQDHMCSVPEHNALKDQTTASVGLYFVLFSGGKFKLVNDDAPANGDLFENRGMDLISILAVLRWPQDVSHQVALSVKTAYHPGLLLSNFSDWNLETYGPIWRSHKMNHRNRLNILDGGTLCFYKNATRVDQRIKLTW